MDETSKRQMGSFAPRRPAAGNLPHFSLPSTASDIPRQTAGEHSESSESSSLKPGSGWSGTAQTSPSSVSTSGYLLGPTAPPADTKADGVHSQDMYGIPSWQLGPLPTMSSKSQNMPSTQHEAISHSHSHNPNSPRPPNATSDTTPIQGGHQPPSVSGQHRDTKSDFQGGLLSNPHGYGSGHQLNYGYKPPYPMPGAVMSNIHQPGAPLTMFAGMPMTSRSPSWPNMSPTLGSHTPRSHGVMTYPMSHHGPSLGDRLFKCDQCPQSFNRNHDLKRHKRIHLAVKPFPCGDCDKSFSRKDALKRHKLMKPNCGSKRVYPEGSSGLENQKPLEADKGYGDSTRPQDSTLVSTSGTDNMMAPIEQAAWLLDGEANTNSGKRRHAQD